MSLAARAGEESSPIGALELLSDVAVALGHGVGTDALLGDLVAGARRLLKAPRVSLLLLNDDDQLVPAVAAAHQQDEALWQRFRSMPPIAVGGLPGAWDAFAAGKAVVIEDAAHSPWVPAQWRQQFEVGSLAIAPLHVAGTPAGVLIVDQPPGAAPVTPGQVTLLEGLAALAGVALRGIRDRGEPELIATVATATRAMTGARTPRAVAEALLAHALETASSADGLVALLHPAEFEVLAVRGEGWPEPGRHPQAGLPAEVLTRCAAAWEESTYAPVQVSLRDDSLLVGPLPDGDHVAGAVVLRGVRRPDTVAAHLQVQARVGGLALHALELHDTQRQSATLSTTLRALLTEPHVELTHVAAQLATPLRALSDTDLVEVVAADRKLARTVGLRRASGEVSRLVSSWRRTGRATAAAVGDGIAVPLTVGERVVGALLVRSSSTPDQLAAHPHLQLVAAGFASAIAARHDARQLAVAERAAAAAAAQSSVTARCYHDLGQVLDQLSAQLRRPSQAVPEVALHQLAAARRLVRDGVQALEPSGAGRAGLRAALSRLVDEVYGRSGLAVVTQFDGRLPTLDPAAQVATLQTVRQLLTFLQDVRAGAAFVHASASGRLLTVGVRPDPSTSPAVDLAGAGLHAVVNRTRGWLSTVDGHVEVDIVAGQPSFRLTLPTEGPQDGAPARPAAAVPVAIQPYPRDHQEGAHAHA